MNKKYVKGILALAAIFIVYIAMAQNVTTKQTAVAAQKFEYCSLIFKYKWNTYTGANISSQTWVEFNGNGQGLYQEDKVAADQLNNVMDAMNYLGSKGWELTTTYMESGEGWSRETHVLKRKK